MKLLIISAGTLPLPVTRGGAVETLIEYIIDQNENEHDFDATVVSAFDEKSERLSLDYKFSKFIYLRRNKTVISLLNLFSVLIYKIFKIKISGRIDYMLKLKSILYKDIYDKVVIENDTYYVAAVKNIQKDADVYLHLHNDYLNINTSNSKELYDSCRKVIVVSKYIQRCVMTISNIDVKRVPVLMNCTNTDVFDIGLYKNERITLRKKLGISENDIVFLFSGRVSKTKGIKELCLALKRIKNKNVKLLIIGSAWYGNNKKDKFTKELEQITRSEAEKIIFTGFIDRDEVPKYHAVADVAVIPSIWEEPAGLVVLEAMSSGLPLIVTNSGGIVEFVNEESAFIINRDSGLVNNLALAMEKLMEDPKMRNEMGSKAKILGKQYTTQNYYRNFINILMGEGIRHEQTQS